MSKVWKRRSSLCRFSSSWCRLGFASDHQDFRNSSRSAFSRSNAFLRSRATQTERFHSRPRSIADHQKLTRSSTDHQGKLIPPSNQHFNNHCLKAVSTFSIPTHSSLSMKYNEESTVSLSFLQNLLANLVIHCFYIYFNRPFLILYKT